MRSRRIVLISLLMVTTLLVGCSAKVTGLGDTLYDSSDSETPSTGGSGGLYSPDEGNTGSGNELGEDYSGSEDAVDCDTPTTVSETESVEP